jgi:hypothetical protein
MGSFEIYSIFVAASMLVNSLLFTHNNDKIFDCQQNMTQLDANQGLLSINRSVTSCGFLTKESKFITVQTDSLHLFENDSLTITPLNNPSESVVITGAQDSGYIILGARSILTFKFNTAISNDSVMLLKFNQDSEKNITFKGDDERNITIRSVEFEGDITVTFNKSKSKYFHVEDVDSAKFGHYLLEKNNLTLTMELKQNHVHMLKVSRVFPDCSRTEEADNRAAFSIRSLGSDEVGKAAYKCVL